MTPATAPLRKPAPGDGIVLIGLSKQPRAARVEQEDGDIRLIVGQGLASHAGRGVEVIFMADESRATVVGELEGPPNATGDLVLLRLASDPRPIGREIAKRVALRTTVVVEAAEWDSPAVAVSEDLSATGVRARLGRALSADAECRLTLTLPDGSPIAVDARGNRPSPALGPRRIRVPQA
ncbi:MAG: hypothetical protein ACR2N6_09655, partial [Miltoncostaeaceae bacterium]